MLTFALKIGFVLMGLLISFPVFLSSSASSDSGFVQIRRTMELVADWQLSELANERTSQSQDWIRATFYIGLARLAETTNEPRYWTAVREIGERSNWRLGPRIYIAD